MANKAPSFVDYADSRNLRGDDARVERLGRRQGLTGESSLLLSGKSGEPTASDIRSAKAEAVGGKPKRCVKGKSCSAACIDAREDCLVEFPEPVQKEINKMREFIYTRAAKRGEAIEAGSERAKQIESAITGTARHLNEQGSFKKTAGSQQTTLTRDEIVELKKNRDRMSNAEASAKAREAWQKEVFSRGVTLSRKDLEDLYESLPDKAKKQLNGSGAPPKGGTFGVGKDGKETYEGSGPNKERGLRVLEMYLRQGGTDAYGNRNKVFSPAEFDVEHIIPMARGKAAGGIDHPSNWVLARGGAQRKRGDKFFAQWIDSLPNPNDAAAMRQFFGSEARKLRESRLASALARSIAEGFNIREASLADIRALKPKVRKKLDYFAGAPTLIPGGSLSGRISTSLPGKLHVPYLYAKKHLTPEQLDSLRSNIVDAWNNGWVRGQGSTTNLVSTLTGLFRSALPVNVYQEIQGDIDKWAESHLKKYPNPGGMK